MRSLFLVEVLTDKDAAPYYDNRHSAPDIVGIIKEEDPDIEGSFTVLDIIVGAEPFVYGMLHNRIRESS
jgi:hypothetical protein